MELPEQIYNDIKDQLPALKEALAQGVSYSSDVMQRFIYVDISKHTFYLLFSLFCLIYLVSKLKKWNGWISEKQEDKDSYVEELWALAYLWNVIPFFLLIITFIMIEAIIKDIFIPEIRIIEILSGLFNN